MVTNWVKLFETLFGYKPYEEYKEEEGQYHILFLGWKL